MTNDDVLAQEPDETLGFEPSDAEIEEWAKRERERREAWLRGPTQAQKRAWADRERVRRLSDGGGRAPTGGPRADPARLAQHYLREMQLAAEGAVSLVFKMSLRDMFDNLVRAGREWEDEYTSRPTQRRRVALYADQPGMSPAVGQPSTRTSDPSKKSSNPD